MYPLLSLMLNQIVDFLVIAMCEKVLLILGQDAHFNLRNPSIEVDLAGAPALSLLKGPAR